MGAFQLDMHSFRRGCDALWTGTLLLELAITHKGIWAERFETDEAAEVSLANLKQAVARVQGTGTWRWI